MIVKKEEYSSDEDDKDHAKILSRVKLEQKGFSSDDSLSSSESDNKVTLKYEKAPIDATKIKKRKHSESESSAKELPHKSKKRKISRKNKSLAEAIKTEASKNDSSEEEPPRPKESKKKRKTSSLENLINKVKKEKGYMANTSIAEPDTSIGNYTAFDSPTLSSTMSATPSKEKKKKNKY